MTGYPSIDKPWLKYYSEEAVNALPSEKSIYQAIKDNNTAFPNETALLYFGKKISYSKLFQEADRTAEALWASGVREGMNIAVCMPAVPETIYLILAANKLGANAVLLNPTFTTEQLSARILETEATLLFTINELWDRVESAITDTSIKTVISCSATNSLGVLATMVKGTRRPDDSVSWNAFVRRRSNDASYVPPYRPDCPAITVFSSGTTGASKGIQLTNGGINASITDGANIGFEWSRQDRYFAQVPIWFSTGIIATVLVPLHHGITVILEPQYDFDVFYDHIDKYQPNFMITAVGLLEHLMSKREINPAYKAFKHLIAGGEYVTSQMEDKLNRWLQKNGNTYGLHKGYGMCECGGTVSATSYACNKKGSAGIPLPHVIVAAFDSETDKELPFGHRGEIRVLTPSHMKGYYKNPTATDDFFWEDDAGNLWACTGDMGYVDEDGCLYVSGRISDSYENEQGETIFLFDIERAVLDVAGVKQCKAVATMVESTLTHVCHVALYPGVDREATLSEISDHCTSALPKSHQPSLFKFHESLPVSPSGKLDIAKMQADVDGLVGAVAGGDAS